MNDLALIYIMLEEVYKGGYSTIILAEHLPKAENKAFVTSMFYGVLEKDIQLEYYIEQLVEKRPKRKERTLLKLGLYSLKYSNTEDYAVCDSLVELAKQNKTNPSFVNAVLRKFQSKNYEVELPKDKDKKLSVESSKPLWLVKVYKKQYPDEFERLLYHENSGEICTRVNTLKTTVSAVEKIFKQNKVEYRKTEEGALLAKSCKTVKKLFKEGLITYQSLCSQKVARTVADNNPKNVLDMCSAPGGKAVYIAELLPKAEITACDIHPHRVELIKKYADRLGITNVICRVQDATEYNKSFENKFDAVLCDVPCSGLGVVGKKPDILLNKTYEDCLELAKLQFEILEQAWKYLRVGGVLTYSTCTTMREENIDVANKFFSAHENARLSDDQPYIQYLPDNDGHDGYFILNIEKI